MSQSALFEEAFGLKKSAVFSPCRTYRYELWRTWEPEKPFVQFIGLNPSTADETNDDPTLRRCIDFAQRWGYGGMVMTNLFAYRSTQPDNLLAPGSRKKLRTEPEPVGPENDGILRAMAGRAGVIVVAWGSHDATHLRVPDVLEVLKGYELNALKVSEKGAPYHPLYLPAVLTPQLWTPI